MAIGARCKVDDMVLVHVLIPISLRRILENQEGSLSSNVRACCWKQLTERRGPPPRELTLTPGRTLSTPDQMMEWLLARQPLVSDFQDGGGELALPVRKAVRKVLSDTQARRVEMRMTGMSLSQIAAREKCTKQAIHTSITRANEALGGSLLFAKALVAVADPDGELGINPRLLLEANRGQEET